MNFDHTIVEVAPNQFVHTRQNIHSEVWQCGDVRSRSCLNVALTAAHNNLVSIYPTIEDAVRALFAQYPPEEIRGNIAFLSAVDIRPQKEELPVAVFISHRERPSTVTNNFPKCEL